jgi:hypothetical protein
VGDVRNLVADRTGRDILVPDGHTGDLGDEPPDDSFDPLLEQLLLRPLTLESAVHIALVNNQQLRMEYARLGIAAAAVYDAGRLSNPGFGVAVMYASESSAANKVTFGLAQSFTDLLLLSSRSSLAGAAFERSKQEAAGPIQFDATVPTSDSHDSHDAHAHESNSHSTQGDH